MLEIDGRNETEDKLIGRKETHTHTKAHTHQKATGTQQQPHTQKQNLFLFSTLTSNFCCWVLELLNMHISFHCGRRGNMFTPLKNVARWRECVEIMEDVYLKISAYERVTLSGSQSAGN